MLPPSTSLRLGSLFLRSRRIENAFRGIADKRFPDHFTEHELDYGNVQNYDGGENIFVAAETVLTVSRVPSKTFLEEMRWFVSCFSRTAGGLTKLQNVQICKIASKRRASHTFCRLKIVSEYESS